MYKFQVGDRVRVIGSFMGDHEFDGQTGTVMRRVEGIGEWEGPDVQLDSLEDGDHLGFFDQELELI